VVSLDAEGADVVTGHYRLWQFNRNFWMFGGHEEYTVGGTIPNNRVTDGQTVYVTATLQGDSGTIDTGTVSATWSTGLEHDATQDLLLHQSVGGLTTTEAAQLQTAADFATHATPTGVPLGHLAGIPLISDLVAHVGAFTLTGRGTIVPPSFAGVPLAYGIVVEAVDVPAGFGLRDGFVQTFRERVGQFVVMEAGLVTGQLVAAQVEEVKTSAQVVWFQQPLTAEVGYDVTPGCVLHCAWLTPITP
jgi:hypothetical protein